MKRIVVPMFRRAAAAAVVGLALAPSPVRADACKCRHLEAVGVALHNTIYLREAYRRKSNELRPLDASSARTELDGFVQGLPEGMAPAPSAGPGSGPRRVPYIPVGDSIAPDQLSNFTDDQLCQASPASMQILGQALQAAPCDAIGQSTVTHEQYHWAFCRSIGYRAYHAMHASEDAQEEVEAYAADVPILRDELVRLLRIANLRVVVTVRSNTTFPPNPLYSTIHLNNDGEVKANNVVPAGDLVKIEADGTQATTGSIEGSCEYEGMPITIPANAVLETDGWSVMVDYGLSGTVPSFGIRCRLPGGGEGAGMSIPSPIPPVSSPAKAEVRLHNGAQELKNLAESEAARILARGGIGLTGSTSVQLKYDCPPGD